MNLIDSYFLKVGSARESEQANLTYDMGALIEKNLENIDSIDTGLEETLKAKGYIKEFLVFIRSENDKAICD